MGKLFVYFRCILEILLLIYIQVFCFFVVLFIGVMFILVFFLFQLDVDKENYGFVVSKSLKCKFFDDYVVVLVGLGMFFDDIDFEGVLIDMNCDQVCCKINNFFEFVVMIKIVFVCEIGVSVKLFLGFLGVYGFFNGLGFVVYENVWEWFKKREMFGIFLLVGKK